MKKTFILVASMILLVGCVESVAVIGTGASNGKIVQSSLQSGVSYGIKHKTGRSPMQHVLNYNKEEKVQKKQDFCSSFTNKKNLEMCLNVKERIISKHTQIKKKDLTYKPSKETTSSLRSSINEKSKIKYLD